LSSSGGRSTVHFEAAGLRSTAAVTARAYNEKRLVGEVDVTRSERDEISLAHAGERRDGAIREICSGREKIRAQRFREAVEEASCRGYVVSARRPE
jgi:hypothetical protein